MEQKTKELVIEIKTRELKHDHPFPRACLPSKQPHKKNAIWKDNAHRRATAAVSPR